MLKWRRRQLAKILYNIDIKIQRLDLYARTITSDPVDSKQF